MKERFALLAAYFKEKFAIGKKSGKEKRKSMILSIVALVEVLAIAIVSVSAWVETISTIKLDLNTVQLITMCLPTLISATVTAMTEIRLILQNIFVRQAMFTLPRQQAQTAQMFIFRP